MTAAAGANVAAVNYHFGSKAALLRALVVRTFAGVHAAQLAGLAALEAATPDPPLDALLRAFAAPIFALFDAEHAGEWGRVWMAAREAAGERERPPMQFADTAVTRRYHAALVRALPRVPPDELWWRFERANNLLLANQGLRASLARGGGDDAARPGTERAWLLAFLAGALAAPATPPGADS